MIKTLFVLLGDIIDKEGSTILEQIGIEENKTYKRKPSNCPSCKKKSMTGIEIIGAYDGDIIWQCLKCGDRFLKLPQNETIKLLENATEAWTNPSDWGQVDKILH